ncbi:MAG TPA: PKD domain-containing protein, partial [Vicinamibacterales bacterium]
TPAPVIPPVTASFDFTPNAPTTADTLQFNDRSSGTPTSWTWSFGDGSVSYQQNPQHRYGAAGTYMVTVTVANSVSSSQATRSITVAPIAPYRSLVSATAQTNGAGGSVWRTELTILNAGSESAFGQLILLPGAGGSIQSRPLYLAPRQAVTYANALLDIYGISSGVGAIAIEANGANSTPTLKVTSRTFTTSTSGGTYGQSVPEVSASDLQTTLYITGIESDAAYRTNIGLVNRSDATVGAALVLYDANGNVIGSTGTSIPANNFSQGILASYFPQIANLQLSGLSMRVDASSSDAISAYASVIDNRTQDPVYIQAAPLRSGSERLIPAVGRAGGANGTFWRSDVTLYNPTSSSMTVALRYLAANTDNSSPLSRSLVIQPGHTIVIADVLQNWFGLSSGTGSLAISNAPIVTSRTYTTASGGGTYGQSIDPAAAFGTDAWVPGLRSDSSFRSNVGFVNNGTSTIGVTLTLVASNGQTVGNGFVTLAPRSMTQGSVANFFPGVDVASLGSFTLEAHSDTGSLFAYGSIVDNNSGDPVFYAGE